MSGRSGRQRKLKIFNKNTSRSSKSTATPLRKVVLSLADCEDLRVILSVLYIITEVIRYEKEQGTEKYKSLFENFSQEIRK